MDPNRRTAIAVGACFLIAMVASLSGGSLLDAMITAPDYLAALAEGRALVTAGVFLELTNAVAVLGIAVFMLPILSRYSQQLAFGYLALRILEAVFCSVVVITPLSLVTLGEAYGQATAAEAATLEAAAALALAQRESVYNVLILVFFCLSAVLFYYQMYRAAFLPRFIAIWGLVAVALVFTLNVLPLVSPIEFPPSVAMVFALPIIANEVFLGIWLIVKGFRPPALVSPSAPRMGRA